MTRFWKNANWIILGVQGIICLLGIFYKHIAFGWGLGDLLWYGNYVHTLNNTISFNNKNAKTEIAQLSFLWFLFFYNYNNLYLFKSNNMERSRV